MSENDRMGSVGPPPLIGYCRVSTDEQADSGVSLAAQRERVEAYAKAAGFVLSRVVEDGGVSGSVHPSKRPAMSWALAEVRAKRAGGIVALKLDRFSRRLRDTMDLLDDSSRRGWRLVSVSETLDTGSATGRLIVHILAALAQMEREQCSERTKAGMEQLCREGRRRSGRAPFGWGFLDGDLVVNEEERAILGAMLASRGEGRGSSRVAATLNDAGTENPRTGGAWTPGTVAAILRTHDRRARALTGTPGVR
jgi:site-specific DNA recombinase